MNNEHVLVLVSKLGRASALGAALLGLSGCMVRGVVPAARVTISEEVADSADVVPADIQSRPHRDLEGGGRAYLVDGRWYTWTPDRGWVVFRQEPRELARYRTERAPSVAIDGYAAERVTQLPRFLDRHPSAEWRGRRAWLVDGRWYLSGPGGWFVLRDEPTELSRLEPDLAPFVVLENGLRAERVREVPADIKDLPSADFEGRRAYLREGRWFLQRPDGSWVVLRDEPPTLERSRVALEAFVDVGGARAERVRDLPSGIGAAPRASFAGHDAYLVGSRWYLRSPEHGWVVLLEEPAELSQFRNRLEEGAERLRTRVEGHLAEPASDVPSDLTKYPRVPYGDSFAYLVDGRWYYLAPAGWVVFREEPAELRRYRIEIERSPR